MVGINMKIKIDAEGGGLLDAIEYAATHVIVSRADLDKIKAWARSKGNTWRCDQSSSSGA